MTDFKKINDNYILQFIRNNTSAITMCGTFCAMSVSAILNINKYSYLYGQYVYYGIDKNIINLNIDDTLELLMYLSPVGSYVLYLTFIVMVMNKRKSISSCVKDMVMLVFPVGLVLAVLGTFHVNFTVKMIIYMALFHLFITVCWGYIMDQPWYRWKLLAIMDLINLLWGHFIHKASYSVDINENNDVEVLDKSALITKILIFVMIIMGCITLGMCTSYMSRYDAAVAKRKYDIINLNGNSFVVVDSSKEKNILQKCDVNEENNIVVIHTNTYIVRNIVDDMVTKRKFDTVIIE